MRARDAGNHRNSEDAMQHFSRWLIAVVVVLGLAGIGYQWWTTRSPPREQAPAPIAALPPALPPVSAPAAAPAPAAAAHHPIEAAQPQPRVATPLPDEGGAVREALIQLLGRRQVLSFLDLGDFARRVVATVDNLAHGHAASRLWPVLPAPERFLAVEREGVPYIADANMDRYRAFVQFAASVDTAAAVSLYVRMYPLLQKAYEELGYPGRYFNNRMIEVIDQLLQTPEVQGPIALSLTEVRGPIKDPRPWVRYEFADPDLQARPAGQKILLRMGNNHALQLKVKLRELRGRIATGVPAS